MKAGALDVHEIIVGEFAIVTTVYEVVAHVELIPKTTRAKKNYIAQLAIAVPVDQPRPAFEKAILAAVQKHKNTALMATANRVKTTRSLDFLREGLPEEET